MIANQVYSGLELGSQDAAELMAARYGHLAGVLGDTKAGKTCFLCAMYLLASCRELHPRFTFGGSRTLHGFETRLRLLRRWEGTDLPQKIVDHTILTDPRRPGLLHLILQDSVARRTSDFFFTDLPGEWSKALVTSAASAERLFLLQRADSLIVTFDASDFQHADKKHVHLQWGRLLLQRLVETVQVDVRVPLVLMLTKCDLYGAEIPEGALRLQETAGSLGFSNTHVIPIVSFSSRPEQIASGTGITEVLEAITAESADSPQQRATIGQPARAFLDYGAAE